MPTGGRPIAGTNGRLSTFRSIGEGADAPAVYHLRKELMTQHPTLHRVDVRCSSCGTSFSTRSTAPAISVEICSNCHPAYTGRERAVTASGRVERFNRRRALAAA
jgi:large subunit ribosomal protein L31